MSRIRSGSQHTVNVIQPSGGLAIRATGVEQRFGNERRRRAHAARRRSRDRGRHRVRPARPQRRGQDHARQHPHHARRRPRPGARRSRASTSERDAKQVRARIGLTGQYAAVDEDLTGRENLRMIGRLLGMPKAAADARSRELLERFDLADASERRASTYSGGMRRRLDLGAVARGPARGAVPRRAHHRTRPFQGRVELWRRHRAARSISAPRCCSPRSTSKRPTASPTRSACSTPVS